MAAQSLPVVYESQISEMYGGRRNLGTKVGKFFKKVGEAVKKVAKSDVGKKLGRMAKDKALKMAEDYMMGSGMTGAGMTGAGMTGAGMTGGRSMGRKRLMAMLNE